MDPKLLSSLGNQGRAELSANQGESTGQRIAQSLYDELPTPAPDDQRWAAPIRRKFDVDSPSDPELGWMSLQTLTLAQLVRPCPEFSADRAQLERGATSSLILMWQQRHPELVGTDADPIKRVERILYDQRGYKPDTPVSFSTPYGTVVLRRL